jgi:hypothetical protein
MTVLFYLIGPFVVFSHNNKFSGLRFPERVSSSIFVIWATGKY